MQTYLGEGIESSSAIGFEIDNIYVSLGKIVNILEGIHDVTVVKKRKLFTKWEGIHIWFNYLNHECVVVEPFGDSSRYWIGFNSLEEGLDISVIESAFRQYQPPLIVKVLGDLIMLNFRSLFNYK